MGITVDGRVGIGIASGWEPRGWTILSRLNVGKGMGSFTADVLNGATCIGFNAAKYEQAFLFGTDAYNNGGALIWADTQGALNFSTKGSGTADNGQGGPNAERWVNQSWALNDRRLRISPTGQVQIGRAPTTAPHVSDYKLAVDGKLVARSVYVTAMNNWADFVFEPTYPLLPLPELESYLQTYRHLPAIPAAREVVANGIDLGEMQARLLQTVEELTLHVIALNKQQEQLRAQVATLTTQLQAASPAAPVPAATR